MENAKGKLIEILYEQLELNMKASENMPNNKAFIQHQNLGMIVYAKSIGIIDDAEYRELCEKYFMYEK